MLFKNVISIRDFSKNQLFGGIIPGCREYIESVKARELKEANRAKKVTLFFTEPSTRTKGSFWEATRFLGWERYMVDGAEATSLAKKESLANTARMFALYNTDVLVMRSKIEGSQRFVSEKLEEEGHDVSVQNAGDGTNQHPTQTFLDILTILEELNRLCDFKIGFWGDLKYGRVIHSLLCALSLQENISVALCSPPEMTLQQQYKKLFKSVEESHSTEVLTDCDVIVMGRHQSERSDIDPVSSLRAQEAFKLTLPVLNTFKKGVKIMHPLPYVGEITPEVRLHKSVIVDEQAWRGIPTRVFTLEEGYKNRKEKVLPSAIKGKLETVKEIPLAEYLQEKGKINIERRRYFSPVLEGSVIDHLPKGLGFKIMSFISGRLGDKRVRHTIENVPSKRYIAKDVLIVENTLLPDDIMIGISSLAPTATFNLVGKDIFKKIKMSGDSVIVGIGKCPNENCITNHDPEAVYKFIPSEEGPQCYYCEKQFSREEVLA
jgi:aspartate carbamoyltransferase catalytic subunit